MTVLFVCTGNTCRSPMAQGYLASKHFPDVTVLSAGIYASGEPANPYSIAVMREKNIYIASHTSVQLCDALLEKADRIICMTRQIADLIPTAYKSKTAVPPNDIPDPFGRSIEVYRKTRDIICSYIDSVFPTVTTAEICDTAAIAELEKQCFSLPWSEKVITAAMQNGTTEFFTAKIGNKTVGYAGIGTVLDEGYITNIAVDKDYRRRGIADALLTAIDALAAEKNLSFTALEVRCSNTAAISLYAKKGYRQNGCRKNFYENPREDALLLIKEF